MIPARCGSKTGREGSVPVFVRNKENMIYAVCDDDHEKMNLIDDPTMV